MNRLTLTLAAASAALLSVSGAAAATIGGNDGYWGWEGAALAGLRSAVDDSANFGAGGTVSTEVDLVDLTAINATTLAGLDIFVAGYWYESSQITEQDAVYNWFLSGGNLFVLADSPSYDRLNSALGIPSISGTSNPTTVTGSLNGGSFGAVGQVNQSGSVAHFDSAAILTYGGEIQGTDSSGQATVATFEAGSFGPNSGRLVLFADVNLVASGTGSGYFDALYSPMNAQGRLALNAVEYLVDGVDGAVPLPAGLPLILTAFGGLAILRRRRAKS